MSTDQLINYPLVCKNTDIFSELEKKLYVEFPALKNKNLIFIANGNIIKKDLSLEENKIKNDTTIIINEMEDDD